jgi:hypothetical protein
MKRILFLILLTISSNCFSQQKVDGTPMSKFLINEIRKITKKNVVLFMYREKEDTITVVGFTTYNKIKEKDENFDFEYVKKYYPRLLKLFYKFNK